VPGQRADFLLIDRNIETASPTDIRGTQVLETWINGKRVYVKGQ
jgi:predicted amidohydrolase YtcJ